MCSISDMLPDDVFAGWYFTRTTIENSNPIDTSSGKYVLGGVLSQILTVNNVNLSDEGYYFCQLRRNDGQLIRQQGSCLRVLGKSMCQV